MATIIGERKDNRKLWYTWYRCIVGMNPFRAALAAMKMQDMNPFDL